MVAVVMAQRKSLPAPGKPKDVEGAEALDSMRFGEIVVPFPTPEEAVAALLANGLFDSVVERMLRECFGVRLQDDVNELMRRGRRLLEARACKTRVQHAVDSLNFYLAMASNIRANDYVRLEARARVDKLLGLDSVARAAMEDKPTDDIVLNDQERREVDAAVSATMRKAMERTAANRAAQQRLGAVAVETVSP